MQINSKSGGFTLIEAMVALAILSIGILGVGKLLQVSLYHDRSITESRNADRIARQIVEKLKGDLAQVPVYRSIRDLQNFAWTTDSVYDVTDDRSFQKLGSMLNPPGCDDNCFESWGRHRGLIYNWRVTDSRNHAQMANTWKLTVTVGWSKCTGETPSSCSKTTRITNFIVPMK